MPQYEYIASEMNGKTQTGSLLADSRSEALAKLKASGIFVTSLEEKNLSAFSLDDLFSAKILIRVSSKELTLFFRQLSVMLKSGVSLVHAITVLQKQSKSGMKRLLKILLQDLQEGMAFSESMRNLGKFSLYDISMVKAAEESGELDLILDSVATQMEKNQEFRSQLITSMIYPVMISIMAIGVMIILSVFVVPKFATILGGKGKSLPAITQAMLNISDWMQEWWVTGLKTIGACILAFPLLKKNETFAYLIDWFLLKIPVLGSVLQCGFIVNFSRNLSILLRSGVVLSDAMITVRDTLQNSVARKVITETHQNILEGEGIAQSFRNHASVFPPMVAEMVSTGEETGEMVQVLELTADIYQRMLETSVKRMNALIEPLIIVVLGGMVGFVVIALMMGVISMYGSVR